MNCLRCGMETSGDYPACSNCAPFMHFEYRADCRCQDAECTAKRLSAHTPTEVDHHRGVIGGGLRMKTIARLCNLGPDDDGEEFVPMTDAELAAVNARFIANPEPSF